MTKNMPLASGIDRSSLRRLVSPFEGTVAQPRLAGIGQRRIFSSSRPFIPRVTPLYVDQRIAPPVRADAKM
jgi:hypothetical protein